MPRIHWTIPEALMNVIEAEAEKRMKTNIKARGQTLGTMSRDLVIACILTGMQKVREMNKKELEEILEAIFKESSEFHACVVGVTVNV